MNRRDIIRGLLGGAGAAASGMSPKEAAKAIGAPGALDMGEAGQAQLDHLAPHVPSRPARQLRRIIYARQDAYQRSEDHLPAHIRSKKSWSPVFKAACYERELIVINMLLEKIDDDETFASKVLGALGIGRNP